MIDVVTALMVAEVVHDVGTGIVHSTVMMHLYLFLRKSAHNPLTIPIITGNVIVSIVDLILKIL